MKRNKFKSFCLCIVLCVSTFGVVAQAADYEEDIPEAALEDTRVLSNENIKSKIITTVSIEDAETGQRTSYEIENEDIELYTSPDGVETTAVINIGGGDEILTRDAGQTASNTLYGWKGNVRITWIDDGTFIRLTSAGGDWTRISGSLNMTNKSINYGQSLGTNSRSGNSSFTNSYNIALSWPGGKYGFSLNHFLGANINGLVNGKWVNVTCNYYI